MLQDLWGSKTQRLGADSMRRFDQCALCLSTADKPVTCPQGHLTCRECAITNLLEQSKANEQAQRELQKLEQEHALERERAREQARAKVLADFERQSSVGGGSGSLGE